MSSDRWRKVESVFHAAIELDTASRQEFVAQACGDDEDLRRRVESLLAREAADDGRLDLPAWEGASSVAEDSTSSVLAPGAKLGPYEIAGLIGAGGMGRVYRAIDSRLGR